MNTIGWIKIHREVLENLGGFYGKESREKILFYLYLKSKANPKNVFSEKQEKIATFTGITQNRVKSLLREFVNKGLIKRQENTKGKYILNNFENEEKKIIKEESKPIRQRRDL